MAYPQPHLVPKVLEKSRAISLLNLRVCVAYKKGENPPITMHGPLNVKFGCVITVRFVVIIMVILTKAFMHMW